MMTNKTQQDYKKDYTKPTLRENLKEKIKNNKKGGAAGKWSARKSQLLKKEYESNGGDYAHKNKKTQAQKNLTTWQKKNPD